MNFEDTCCVIAAILIAALGFFLIIGFSALEWLFGALEK
jgi:hypothetical protein